MKNLDIETVLTSKNLKRISTEIASILSAIKKFRNDYDKHCSKVANKGMKKATRGRGRPLMLTDSQMKNLRKDYFYGDMGIFDICQKYNVSRATLYTYIKRWEEK